MQSNSPLSNVNLLKNIVILNNSQGHVMAQIYFDTKSKKLFISSSSITSAVNGTNEYFSFKLTDTTGKETISTIIANDNADNLADSLNNNITFKYGDTITLNYAILSRVSIENYPNYNVDYKLLKSNERFTITAKGLVSLSILRNNITFLGLSNRLVAQIYFNIDDKKLIVTSSGRTAHPTIGNREYFKVTLKDTSNQLIKEAAVKGSENANAFATTLNDTSFEVNYTITINFAEKARVLVSNYPNEGDIYRSPNNNPKTFTITSNGLVLNIIIK